jgi:pantetheine-phosphate adenylyltransferase
MTPTASSARVALYPGSFDPLTNGHVDVVRRASRLFDRLVVAILVNGQKTPLLATAERLELARTEFRDFANVEVDAFEGLLVDYAVRRGATCIVRGLRGVGDFDYELQMAQMNRKLNDAVETIFLMPAAEFAYVSSRLVKEVAGLGGRVTGLVPPHVEERLRARFKSRS